MSNESGGSDQQFTDEELGKINVAEIDPETATPEQIESLKKGFQTAVGQKGHFKEKYERDVKDPATGKTYKELFESAKSDPSKNTPPAAPEKLETLEKKVGELEVEREKRQFGHQHNLAPEEVDLAFQMGGNDPAKAAETLKTDFFKSGLDGLRAKRRTESATPPPSSRVPTVDGKPFDKLSDEEKRQHWPSMTGAKKS